MEADGGAFVRYDPWATIDSEAFTPWGPLSDSWIRTGGRTIWLAASNSKSMRNTSELAWPGNAVRGKNVPLERFIATAVLLPLTFVEEASSVRRAIFCRAHRGSPIELASGPDAGGRGGSAMRASRLDTLQVSSIAILAPGYQARESLGTKGYAIRFPLRPSTTIPLLLRFEEGGEVRRGKVWFPISTGSGHHQVRSENDAAPRPPASK
jgi:hypothetical protein